MIDLAMWLSGGGIFQLEVPVCLKHRGENVVGMCEKQQGPQCGQMSNMEISSKRGLKSSATSSHYVHFGVYSEYSGGPLEGFVNRRDLID